MKKFISAFLLMAAMAFSVSTFVSCNDLTEEMEKVTTTANENAKAIEKLISDLESGIEALDQKIATAQKAADDAKDAAEAAQGTADQAVKDAAAAKQAAADAYTNALKDAKAYTDDLLEKAKAALTEYVNGKVTDLQNQINTLKNDYNTLKERVDGIEGRVETNEGAIAAIKAQIDALEGYLKITGEGDTYKSEIIEKILKDLIDLQNQIISNDTDIEEIKEDIVEINDRITNVQAELATLVYNVLKSIAYVPHTIDKKLNEIEDGFYTLLRCNKNHGEEPDYAKYQYVTSSCVDMTYRFNPAQTDLDGYKFSFVGIDVATRTVANADEANVLDMVSITPDKDGRYIIKAQAAQDLPGAEKEGVDANGKAQLVALKAYDEANNVTVISDYVAVADKNLYNYVIRNAQSESTVHPDYFNVCWWDKTSKPYTEYKKFYPTATEEPVQMQYNETLELRPFVETYCTEIHKVLDDKALPCVNIAYEFKKVPTFVVTEDNNSDQQKFIEVSNGVVSVNPWPNAAGTNDEEESKRAAIGKTPVVEVIAYANGNTEDHIIARAYIKIDIVERKTTPIEIPLVRKSFVYTKLACGLENPVSYEYNADDSYRIDWAKFTSEALAAEGIYLSNEQFNLVYNFTEFTYDAKYETITINGKSVTPTATHHNDLKKAIEPKADPEFWNNEGSTTTAWVGFALNSLVQENSTGWVSITLSPKDAYKKFYPTVTVKLPFSVSHEINLPDLFYKYADVENKIVTVKGHTDVENPAFNWSFESVLHEAFDKASYEDGCDDVTYGEDLVPHHTALKFRLGKNTPAHALITEPTEEGYEGWKTQKITLNVQGKKVGWDSDILNSFDAGYDLAGTLKSDIDDLVWAEVDKDGNIISKKYIDVPVTLYTVLDNKNECTFDYTVRFVNPFSVTLEDVELNTVAKGDLHNALEDVVISFNNGEEVVVVYEKADYVAEYMGVIKLDSEYSIIGETIEENIKKAYNNDMNFHGKPNWLHWTDRGMIYWNNGGDTLLENSECKATIFAWNDQVGWFTIDQPVTVTLLKTPATVGE